MAQSRCPVPNNNSPHTITHHLLVNLDFSYSYLFSSGWQGLRINAFNRFAPKHLPTNKNGKANEEIGGEEGVEAVDEVGLSMVAEVFNRTKNRRQHLVK